MPARTQRLSAPERREDIVATASQLFADKGFSATTTRAIADACRVSEATIFRHFQTKEELYDAIIRTHVEREGDMGITEELAEGDDDRAFFCTVAVNFLHRMTDDRDFWRLLLRSALEDHELATRFFETHVNDAMERMAAHMRRRQEAGTLRNLDPEVTATIFIGMLGHYVEHTRIFKRQTFDRFSRDEAADFIVDVFLRGVSRAS